MIPMREAPVHFTETPNDVWCPSGRLGYGFCTVPGHIHFCYATSVFPKCFPPTRKPAITPMVAPLQMEPATA